VTEIKNECDNLIRNIANDQKNLQVKIKGEKITGKDLLAMDVKRLKTHRDMLADWMYMEMEEHAKKLEIYADLFDKTQNGIDIDDEFMEAMIAINKFQDPRKESEHYVTQRKRNAMVNVRAN